MVFQYLWVRYAPTFVLVPHQICYSFDFVRTSCLPKFPDGARSILRGNLTRRPPIAAHSTCPSPLLGVIGDRTRFCLLPPPSGSFPTLGPPRPQVGRSRYGPKRQVQGDLVTLEKSSPNQTTWAGVQPRPHHFLPTFFNTNFRAVKATVNPPIPQTLVKWPGRVTGTQRKGVRPE